MREGKVVLGLRVSPRTDERLQELADVRGQSKNQTAETLLVQGLDQALGIDPEQAQPRKKAGK